MQFKSFYNSPLGLLALEADEIGLTGIYFNGANYAPDDGEPEIFKTTKRWLDIYFSGANPDFTPPLHLVGTPFRLEVWKILRTIPYGQTTTYGAIAAELASKLNLAKMSAQAVGGAVGRNPISIIVPCHRVIGADGSLTGYAGGIDKKTALLECEGVIIR